jgi:UDP:flavonoid glycosyltransferase YjiC (YdhE family)
MITSSKHIVIFSEAVTLAHVARCISLANTLIKCQYRVTLAVDDRFDALLGSLNFSRTPLYSVSSAYFAKKLSQGLPLYSSKILKEYVHEDLKIIDQLKPDFIIGDFRLSLAISCRLSKVPYATVTNAYWSPYASITYPIPELPLTKIFGVALAQKLFDWIRPLVFKLHSLDFNRACKHFGLAPLSYDMREVYTHADYTLYADIPGIVPMHPLPDNHVFIGPLLWSAETPLPKWWNHLPQDKPMVFVTLGSSGDSRLLPMLLNTLAEMPVTVIAVTAQKTVLQRSYKNVFVADFLPAQTAVKKADIVICNGGSPMVYQSLVAGKAIIGIPSNLDQYLMMAAVQQWDMGILVRAGKASPQMIRNAVDQALELLKSSTSSVSEYEGYQLAVNRLADLINGACNRMVK